MLSLGHIDFAHMLSPMPVAMSLGLGSMPGGIDALMVLSVNGTVTGVSAALHKKMRETGWMNSFDGPSGVAKALFAATNERLRIGVPFPFSMHRLLLNYWLSRDPQFLQERVEIVTIPPPQMAGAVKESRIDMFCVGEPWGSVAVQQCGAALVLPSQSIWQFAPEKVLGARHTWVEDNPRTCAKMIRAVYKAARWLDQPENTPLATEILAHSQHLDLPDHAIDPALSGHIVTEQGDAPRYRAPFVTFHDRSANFPWRSQSRWIAQQLAVLHGLDGAKAHDAAAACFRSDLYRDAVTPLSADLPSASAKVEGAMAFPTAVASAHGEIVLGPDQFFDGAHFDFVT